MNGETLEDIRRSTSKDPLDCLKGAIVTYDNELAINSVKRVVEEKIDPIKAEEFLEATKNTMPIF